MYIISNVSIKQAEMLDNAINVAMAICLICFDDNQRHVKLYIHKSPEARYLGAKSV